MSNGVKLLITLLARLLAATALVFGTFNPTGYSFLHWVVTPDTGHWLIKAGVGVMLVMVYVAVLSITFGALRRSGMIAGMVAGVLFTTQMALWVVPRSHYATWGGYLLTGEYVVLLSFAIMLAFGLSWSSMIERLTGQQQKRYIAGGVPPLLPTLLR